MAQVKEEGWWLLLGDPDSDELHALKRLSFGAKASCTLSVQLPAAEASQLHLYLVCDSYLGMDQQYCMAETPKVSFPSEFRLHCNWNPTSGSNSSHAVRHCL